jgi:hypothetical protein
MIGYKIQAWMIIKFNQDEEGVKTGPRLRIIIGAVLFCAKFTYPHAVVC